MPGDAATEGVCLRFPATPASVRAALMRLFDPPCALPLAADHAAAAQLVLAEVLNNIVEHAYACDGGDISLTCRIAGGCLAVRVVDRGCPLPEAAAQTPCPAALAGGAERGGLWLVFDSQPDARFGLLPAGGAECANIPGSSVNNRGRGAGLFRNRGK